MSRYLEAARKIADGEAVGVCNATGGLGNPYEEKMREYFGAGPGWPWELEGMSEREADKVRILALCFMACVADEDGPVIH